MPSLLETYHEEVRDQLALDAAAFLHMRYFPQGRETMQHFAIALHRCQVFRSDLGRYAALSFLVGREVTSSLDLTLAEYRALRRLVFPQGLDNAPDDTWAGFLRELEDTALAAKPPRPRRHKSGKETGDAQSS